VPVHLPLNTFSWQRKQAPCRSGVQQNQNATIPLSYTALAPFCTDHFGVKIYHRVYRLEDPQAQNTKLSADNIPGPEKDPRSATFLSHNSESGHIMRGGGLETPAMCSLSGKQNEEPGVQE